MYELKIEKFQGPLDKLLELIENKKFQINEISLAEITDDFLAYLKTLENVETGILADFIAVSSRLLLIKSRTLLPDLTLTQEEEGEIKDLTRRLKFYQEFKAARSHIDNLWKKNASEFSRTYFFAQTSNLKFFYPSEKLTLENIYESISEIFKEFEKIIGEEVVKEKIVSLEEKIQEVLGRISRFNTENFQNLTKKKPRSEIIVIFLALLHLAREQLILLEQNSHFSNIIIKPKKS